MTASTIVSIVGAIGSLLIALGTLYKFRKGAQMGAQKTADDRAATVAAETAAELKRLYQEVKDLRTEVAELRGMVDDFREQARKSRETIGQLTNELRDMHRLLTTVRAIFAGYVERVRVAWGKDAKPPVASPIDKAILEDSLSADELALALAQAGLSPNGG